MWRIDDLLKTKKRWHCTNKIFSIVRAFGRIYATDLVDMMWSEGCSTDLTKKIIRTLINEKIFSVSCKKRYKSYGKIICADKDECPPPDPRCPFNI